MMKKPSLAFVNDTTTKRPSFLEALDRADRAARKLATRSMVIGAILGAVAGYALGAL